MKSFCRGINVIAVIIKIFGNCAYIRSDSMIVAILEDSPTQVEWVTKLLQSHGHQAFSRRDGDGFIALLQQQKVDVVLLDWEVPGASGLAVLKWARCNLAPNMPILMLTQRDDEESIVQALNMGADDYLQKPVRERELLARMSAQLRKSQRGEATALQFQVGHFAFNLEAKTLTVDGRPGNSIWPRCCFAAPAASSPRTPCASKSGAPSIVSTTPAWRRTSATCVRRWVCAHATAM
jgi:CheY-like chemotaxis protein